MAEALQPLETPGVRLDAMLVVNVGGQCLATLAQRIEEELPAP